MSISVDDLIAMRDTLIRFRARGVRSAEVAGEKIQFQSDSEMAAAIADLEARIRRASSRRPATARFSSSKGL